MNVRTTRCYDKWLNAIKDSSIVKCIEARVRRIRQGNFGDCKSIGDGVWELRFRIGGGIRIYYTFRGNDIVLLLAGGNKSSQDDDIACAKYIAKNGGKK